MDATYFDGITSRGHAVRVAVVGTDLEVVGTDFSHTVRLSTVRADEPLGKSPRVLYLSGGSSLELAGDQAQLLALIDQNAHWKVVNILERSWILVLVALVGLVGLAFLLVRNGMPVAARAAAFALPAEADKSIGEGGLALLDSTVFEPSTLEPDRQAQIRQQLSTLVSGIGDEHEFRIEFRRGESLGANAFALPSGIIIVTDELIDLSVHADEISAVLAHEVGHVVYRHSLRMLFQDTGTALLLGTLLGDATSMSSLASALPTILVQSSYSRDFENEADAYAVSILAKRNIPKRRLTDLLRRLEGPAEADGESWSYFSTHPPTSERANE